MFKKSPAVVRSKFFVLKFFPALHHLSLVRKSNIAYTFSNRGGSVLNDTALLAAFSKYKGKYRDILFFKTQPSPRDTAVGRTKFRKAVKRSLFSSLHKLAANDVALVLGIFFFKFDAMPATKEDYVNLQSDMDKAVAKITSDKTYISALNQSVKQQNRDFDNGKGLIKEARFETLLGASRVPGYYPKLPFIRTRL